MVAMALTPLNVFICDTRSDRMRLLSGGRSRQRVSVSNLLLRQPMCTNTPLPDAKGVKLHSG